MQAQQVAIPLVRQLSRFPATQVLLDRMDKHGLFAKEAVIDPYPSYERLRITGEVTWQAPFQRWYITGYDECHQILSSTAVSTASQIDALAVVRPYNKLDERTMRFWRNWLLLVDPPDHTRLRRLVNKAFTPRQIARLEAQMSTLVGNLLDQVAHQDEVEIISTFCNPLPMNVICELLGIPEERWEWARHMTECIVQLLDPFGIFTAASVNVAVAEMDGYFGALCEQRRRDPKDDLITALVEAESEGDRLDREELLAMIAFIMGAGHETTTNGMGLAIRAMEMNPDQRDLIKAQPELWPGAVEEFLRFETPLIMNARTITEDLEVGDQTIKAGQDVLLYMGAANRDARRYEDAQSLRLDRPDARPISFGHGMHYCVGAALARLEMRVGLSAFLDAFGDYTVDHDSIEWKTSSVLRGPAQMIVRRSPHH